MQTIHIDVDENKMDILLNIIKNIKEDVVKSYSISSDNKTNASIEDTFYEERKKRLTQLREDIKSGREPMYDFDTSMDTLIEELKA